jgi:hypothetical protein
MEGVFSDGSLGFAVRSNHNVSSTFIYSALEEAAGGMEEWATLLVYLNSHGGGSGDRFAMTAREGSFKFSRAIQAMAKSGRPVRRLILLVDTCHAEGSIQDSTGEDGRLLRNLQLSRPTAFLPRLPDDYSMEQLPFISPFVDLVPTDRKHMGQVVMKRVVDYGEDSGAYKELLIISSSSVEDVSIRGVFASRLSSTFEKAKGDDSMTVGEFLVEFADSHSKSGQQPHYKAIPDESIFGEPLFGRWPAQELPVVNYGTKERIGPDFIPIPKK